MRIRLRYWILSTFLAAFVLSKIVGVWIHDPAQMVYEPVWILPDAEMNSLKTTIAALQKPAPEVVSDISIRQLVQILEDYCPAIACESNLDDEGIQLDDPLPGFKDVHRGQNLGFWLEAALKSNCLTFTIQHGFIEIVSSQSVPPLTRIYPHPQVASWELKEYIRDHIDCDTWKEYGGDSIISVIDTRSQSLIVVTAPYQTHLKIESGLTSLNRSCGIGWRSDAPRWTQVPKATLNALAQWLDSSQPPYDLNHLIGSSPKGGACGSSGY